MCRNFRSEMHGTRSVPTTFLRGDSPMGARRIRREQRAFDMALSRRVNGLKKMAERQRLAIRMKEIISKGKFPYTPAVMSWISVQPTSPPARSSPPMLKRCSRRCENSWVRIPILTFTCLSRIPILTHVGPQSCRMKSPLGVKSASTVLPARPCRSARNRRSAPSWRART